MMQGSGERAIHLGLLVCLVSLMLLPGLLAGHPSARTLTLVLFSLVLLIAVAASSRRRIGVAIALALWVPAVGLRWVPALGFEYTDFVSHAAALLLILLAGTSILAQVLRQRRVTQDTLYGSVCVYLLLGIAWAIAYSLLETLSPGSFVQNNERLVIEAGAEEGVSRKFLYYSLVTMTTLGYGDITPSAELARNLAALEAMAGQLYVAILVARLVAMQVAHSGEQG